MDDLISRADAIKAVEQEYRINRGYMVDDYTYGFNQAIDYVSDIILQDLPSADAVQIPIKLEKRYPESKDEDITDAFMRGYLAGRSSADADCSTCKHKDKDWDSEECDSCCGNNNHYASAEAEWIPCSEKLPDNKTYVLTTIQAIDAVEVVRCKDCRHRDLFSCPLTDNDFQKDEDFCSWGERREE